MNRVYLIVLIIISLFCVIMYGIYDALIIAVISILTPIAGLIITFAIRRHLSMTLTVPETVTRNQTAPVTVNLKGRGLSFLTNLSAVLGSVSIKASSSAKEISFHLPVSFPHCGMEALPKPTVYFSDPFSLRHFKIAGPHKAVAVLPQKIGHEDKILKVLHSLERDQEKEYYGAVPYQRGDNLHLVNWKVSARKGSLFVREPLPAPSEKIAFAAELPKIPEERDVLGDALYSCGAALLHNKEPFLFYWMNTKHQVITDRISDQVGWRRSIKAFLEKGSHEGLSGISVSLDMTLLYLKSSASPKGELPPSSVIWSVVPDREASLSGKHEILEALGGIGHE